MKDKKIGMIGIGLMGHGIASNIVKHGYDLSVLEHPGNQPLDALKAAGVRGVHGARELAAAVDVVILCVTGSPQVEDAMLSEGGVIQGLRPGALVIDCSTALPGSTQKLARAVAEVGARMIDAAMTRTPKEAAEGRLNLLVGGDAALLDECRPLLQCFAEHITHVGPIGAGHGMKLLHNYVSLGSVALIAEAANCAVHCGVAPETFVQVLNQGGGAGTPLERLKPYLLAKDTGGLRFSVSNALKDLGYYLETAQGLAAPHTIADGVHRTLAAACQARPAALMPELVDVLASLGSSPDGGSQAR